MKLPATVYDDWELGHHGFPTMPVPQGQLLPPVASPAFWFARAVPAWNI